jgi:chromosome partitioning protein
MKTIAVSLQKGGVGKTSIAVSLAAELAKETGAVLLIDADPQGSATGWIGPDGLDAELAEVLMKTAQPKEAVIKTGFPGLSLLPTAGLGGSLKVFAEGPALQQPFCMKNLVKEIAALGCRYAVIDLSPGWGSMERAALIAADEVITPILGDSFAADGLEIFANNLKKLREDMDSEKPAYRRIVLNAIDGRIKQHGETLKDIRANAGNLTLYTIPVDPAFRMAQRTGLTLQALAGTKPETKEAIRALALDLLKEE